MSKMKLLYGLFVIAGLGGLISSAYAISAQTELHIQQAKDDACVDGGEGDSCSYVMPGGESVNGFCKPAANPEKMTCIAIQ